MLKINSKMADIKSNMSLLTLDINTLNTPTKKQRLTIKIRYNCIASIRDTLNSNTQTR